LAEVGALENPTGENPMLKFVIERQYLGPAHIPPEFTDDE
jgi:hypothetical protein